MVAMKPRKNDGNKAEIIVAIKLRKSGSNKLWKWWQ